MTLPLMETTIQALLEVLDQDIRHVETVLLQLEKVRALLVNRDDVGLEKLLEDIRRQADAYAAQEQRRQTLRNDLAAQFGWSERDVTLSRLQGQLTGAGRAALVERQVRLKSLIEQLKREHMLTAVLLADCARFNRLLMQALFGVSGKGNMTYSPTGAARRPSDIPLMSLRL